MPSVPDSLQAVQAEAWDYVLWPLPEGEPEAKLPDMGLFDEASFFASSPFYYTSGTVQARGFTSPLAPYLLREDDLVTGVLLCCFVAMAFVFASSKKYVSRRMKYFFTQSAEAKLFPTQTGVDKRNAWFLYLQWGVLASLLFFACTQGAREAFMPTASSHVVLGLYVLTCWAYVGIKQMLYTFVNWIFFNKEKRAAWINSYTFLISSEGALLFPLALIAVYSNAEAQKMIVYSFLVIGFVRLLLAYKTICIFFPKFHCALHFITYLCALEILPFCGLLKALSFLNSILS